MHRARDGFLCAKCFRMSRAMSCESTSRYGNAGIAHRLERVVVPRLNAIKLTFNKANQSSSDERELSSKRRKLFPSSHICRLTRSIERILVPDWKITQKTRIIGLAHLPRNSSTFLPRGRLRCSHENYENSNSNPVSGSSTLPARVCASWEKKGEKEEAPEITF